MATETDSILDLVRLLTSLTWRLQKQLSKALEENRQIKNQNDKILEKVKILETQFLLNKCFNYGFVVNDSFIEQKRKNAHFIFPANRNGYIKKGIHDIIIKVTDKNSLYSVGICSNLDKTIGKDYFNDDRCRRSIYYDRLNSEICVNLC